MRKPILQAIALWILACGLAAAQNCTLTVNPITGKIECAATGSAGATGPTGPSGPTGPTGSAGTGLVSNAQSNITPVTVSANTASDQVLQQISLPAGFFNLQLTQPYTIKSAGIFTIGLAQIPSLTFKVNLCTVSGCGSGTTRTLATYITAATVAATNNPWSLLMTSSITATGATGTLITHGFASVDIGALTTTPAVIQNDTNTASSGTIDLTAALFLQFTVATSAGSALNSFTQQSSSAEPGAVAGTVSPTTYVNGLPLTGASFPAIRSYATASGDVDIFTSPAGKRTLIIQGGGDNVGGNTVAWYFELKSSGSYYRLTSTVSSSTGALATSTAIAIILEAGESLAVNTTASGANFVASAIQFDNTSPMRTVKLLGPSTGNNTWYTVGAGKTAWVMSATGAWGLSALYFATDSGGTRTTITCAVASGGLTTCAVNSVNAINFLATGASSRAATGSNPGITLNTGDFLVLNVDTGAATQIAWINVLEF